MNLEEYKKLVDEVTPKEKRLRNGVWAFVVGGIVGVLCTITNEILIEYFDLAKKTAGIWTIVLLIGVASFLTALGFFDRWVKKAQCGLIIPTSGFAHSVTSSALDYRQDGLITGLGGNLFKLAGCVLLYGILGAFVMTIVQVIFFG